jgi:hypothetical protein
VPVLTLYQSGMKMGCPPGLNSHPRALRGVVDGWSPGATRRNTDFLKSVTVAELDGDGFAVTLSVGAVIPSPAAFRSMFKAWVRALRRMGLVRLHWVIEWQRRGAPHLHVAAYFRFGSSGPDRGSELVGLWVKAAGACTGATGAGQHVTAISEPLAWLQYVAKHASRGAAMYQRSKAAVPLSWRGRTGRLWGKFGDWPQGPVIRLNIEGGRGDGGYYALRRIVKGWRLADARADPSRKRRRVRVRLARRLFQNSNELLSRVMGPAEWLDLDSMLRAVDSLVVRGYSVSDYVSASDQRAIDLASES